MTLHQRGYIQPYWTPLVLDECFRNLLRLGRICETAHTFYLNDLSERVPSACIELAPVYEIDVRCVHQKDRHVAAAALYLRHRLSAEQNTLTPVNLLTWNIRDFPKRPLNKLSVIRFTPDEWLFQWLADQSVTDVFAVLSDAANLMSTWRIGLGDNLTDFQRKPGFWPDSPSAWPEFLHRNWFKQSAKRLSQQLAVSNVPGHGDH